MSLVDRVVRASARSAKPQINLCQKDRHKMLRNFMLVGASVLAFASSIAQSARPKGLLTSLTVLAALSPVGSAAEV